MSGNTPKPPDMYSMYDYLHENGTTMVDFGLKCECGTDTTYENEPNKEFMHSMWCPKFRPKEYKKPTTD